jgi:subtilisin family serine protease
LFQAWSIETGTPNVIVAVTDGGAQVDHPDLAANMWVNTDEIPGNDLDDDNNGFVDDVNGYGFGDNTGEIFPDDHGSHTSGTIAAVTNNAIGVAGVAGGSGIGDGARIMTLAAFGGVGTGGFGESYVYGADNGAVISQNSWGYDGPGFVEQSVIDGIDYFIAEAGRDENGNQVGPMRGGIVIFAAGNDDDNDQYYPGFYDKTLAVGGLTNQDKKAWYSNFGNWVDMSAPGGETFVANDPKGVLSTIAGNQYAFFQGTSMACPHVSGVAALIVSKFGGIGFTPEMLRGRLTQLVDNVDAADPDFVGLLGTGRLNAFKALQEDDGDAPDVITDLAASAVAITSVTLTWTAPSDPGNGSASVYDIRYDTAPITSTTFDSATVVPNPPVPLSAGSSQSYTVAGLLPGTVYYFAIKSADFFGNYSDISNVVEQATNFPPVISVEPDSFVITLQTAQVAADTLTITNSGQGVLHFYFDSLASTDFVTPIPDSGTVAATSQSDILLTIDANDRLPGTYHQDLLLKSNDPLTPSIIIPVTLNVISNGQPIASIEPDSLDFGQVFESGTKQLPVTVHNAGAEVLHIVSVSSSNSDFTTDFADTIAVAPFQDAVIAVTYDPSGLGFDSGTLSVETDDPSNTILFVSLLGEGVPAPDVEVTPSSLSASLNSGNTTTRTLTISNTGGSDLEFSTEVTADASAVAMAPVKTITIPVTNNGEQQNAALQKNAGKAGYANQVKLRSVGQSAAIANVLILSPDDNVADIELILDAFDDVEADVFPKASLPSITLANLSAYDVVFTTNNTQWLQAGGVEPEVIGDLLADYIDAGGKVISNQFNYSYDAWKLEGRFIDDQYGPFIPSTSDANVDVELGDILAGSHPVMEGVSELVYSGFVQNVSLAPGALALAEWDNGELFLAVNENVVALNLLPSLGNGGPLQFSGDLPLIYQNAIHYLSGPGFVEVNPSQGTIAAGEQLDLEVTFDATGLDSGVYEATINIATNVPGGELIGVPATLTVLGPEFTVTPTSLSEELEKDQTSTQTIVLRNNGSDNQTFSVDVEGIGAGVAVATKKIPATATLSRMSSVSDPSEKILRNTSQRTTIDLSSETSLNVGGSGSANAARAAFSSAASVLLSETQYATDFENFDLDDVSGQQGWFGQFGNWRIEAENPYSGSQHFRGLSDGLGLSAAVTPLVPIGTEDKSTTSMKLNIQGSGVTWQIIPESPTAELVNTRIQFAPNGVVSALIEDSTGAVVFDAFATTPSGYFDLTIEVDRDSSYFHVFIDGEDVYTGQGFAGDIEEVVVLSGMEVAGPVLDLDDIKIIDGEKEEVSFLSVSPLSGNLPAGSSVELEVTFNSNNLEFGIYAANINIKVAETKLTVPASLRVFGDPDIDVDPTFLQATVDYKEDTTKILSLKNTGGNPLTYSLQVIGAATNNLELIASQPKKSSERINAATREKIERDDNGSRTTKQSVSSIQLLTGSSLFQEDFEDAAFPPSGWQVIDNEGTGVVWDFAAAYGEDNYSGTGEAATVSSDAFGRAEFDTELITPAISTAGFKNITVQYNVNYQNFLSLDFLDLDIQVDGGAWTNVLSWNEDHGALFGTGEFVTADLKTFIGSGSSFRLRWHYYDPNTDDFDWYAQIDDVQIYGDAKAWLTVTPSSGTIPVQGIADIEAHFDASDINSGSYVAGILVSSNAAEDPLVGVVAQLTVRAPAVMSVTPSSLYQELLVGEQATQTLTISNSGASALKYAFGNTPVPDAVSVEPQERREPAFTRTTASSETLDLTDIRAQRSGISELASVPLYVTGFEDFAPGDINGQKGWAGQFGNWDIEGINPFEGVQHIRSISDGLGATRAFSPSVAIGSDPVSSASVRAYAEAGVTWQVVPQSPTAGFVNTRVQIGADRTLSALVRDSVGNGAFVPIPVTLPAGYFELRIDVQRATSVFTVFVDGTEVFTGQGFAGNIEQLVLFSAMELAGPVWDVDNLAIFDGPAVAPWLTHNPKSGIVPPGGSAMITVGFNAAELEAGFYTDTLSISSNDPAHASVDVPVVLKVLFNTPPALAAIDSVTVIELGAVNVTFTATDIDNEFVTVTLDETLDFITLLDTANGSATYRITPRIR